MKNKRPYKILWANSYCLLDRSSGASLSVLSILQSLKKRGYDVKVVGATNFDTAEGRSELGVNLSTLDESIKIVNVSDDILEHQLVLTQNHNVLDMFSYEHGQWWNLYRNVLNSFTPDLLFTYGGQHLDQLAKNEARRRGIPVVAYLANGNYSGIEWCHDVNLIVTDTQATANYYDKNHGIQCVPVGKFIDIRFDSEIKRAVDPYITFINPELSKGGLIVALIAKLLEELEPSIKFQIVDSRGKWADIERILATEFGISVPLDNVIVRNRTSNMAEVYKNTKILLAPSLWWESGGRVIVEAMKFGIPCIVSSHGGMKELLDDSGVVIDFPKHIHQPPYKQIPNHSELIKIAQIVRELFTNQKLYDNLSRRAKEVAQEKHDIEKNVTNFEETIMHLLKIRAGDLDQSKLYQASNRQLSKRRKP